VGLNALALTQLLPPDYDRMRWPAPNASQPVVVNVSASVGRLHSVDEFLRTITFDMFLSLAWREPRLQLPPNMTGSSNVFIPLPLDVEQSLWTPDLVVMNLRSFKSASIVSPMRSLEVAGDHVVRMNMMGTTTISCRMDFK
jgi:hypothetical protein